MSKEQSQSSYNIQLTFPGVLGFDRLCCVMAGRMLWKTAKYACPQWT